MQKNDMFENITYYKTEFEEAEKLKEQEDKNIIQEQMPKEELNIVHKEANNQNVLIIVIIAILIISILITIINKNNNKKKC